MPTVYFLSEEKCITADQECFFKIKPEQSYRLSTNIFLSQ